MRFMGSKSHAFAHSRLTWAALTLIILVLALPASEPLFTWLFPALERPVYRQETFAQLLWQHCLLVGVSSLVAVVVGSLGGIWVTRPTGLAFKPMVDALAAMGQTFPPVVVLAVAVPLVGFGELPALIALALYGVLPVWLAGVRSSVIINIGTAAIASTVGAKTLGSPIVVGLSGFNTAYIAQGALVVGLLAVVTDMAFERVARQVAWHA